MKKIPADIDQLMWSVAESTDPRAVEDFEQRFPDLKYELGKRVLMLRQLRSARKSPPAHDDIPTFRPMKGAGDSRGNPWRFGIASASLALLAILSYAVTRSLLERPATNAEPVAQDSPERTTWPDRMLAPQPLPERTASADPNPKDQVPGAYSRKVSITIERAPLHNVLQMVAEAAHLELEVAPGLENPQVKMAYQDVDAITVLEDMGKQLGFTPFYQGNGKVLIVPAVDPKRRAEGPVSSGSAQVVDEPTGTPPGNARDRKGTSSAEPTTR